MQVNIYFHNFLILNQMNQQNINRKRIANCQDDQESTRPGPMLDQMQKMDTMKSSNNSSSQSESNAYKQSSIFARQYFTKDVIFQQKSYTIDINLIQDQKDKKVERKITRFDQEKNNNLIEQSSQNLVKEMHQFTTQDIEALYNQKSKAEKYHFCETEYLKTLILQQKINQISNNFIKKLRQNSTLHLQGIKLSEEIDLDHQHKEQDQIKQTNKSFISQCIFSILTLLLFYTTTTQLVYPQSFYYFSLVIKLSSLLFYLISFIQQHNKIIKNRKVSFTWTAVFDMANLIIIMIDLCTNIQLSAMKYLRLVIFTKAIKLYKTIQDLQIQTIPSTYEVYYNLLKLLHYNIILAHFIAVFILRSNYSSVQETNLYFKALADGVKILFNNERQETFLFKISQLSTLFLNLLGFVIFSYNLCSLADIFRKIKQSGQDRLSKRKLLKKVEKQSKISAKLESRLKKYIDEETLQCKKVEVKEKLQFVNSMPKAIKRQVLKQMTKGMFSNLPFFRHAMEKTIINVAERLEIKIINSQETIRGFNENFNLYILRQGKFGSTCYRPGTRFHHKIIDVIKIAQGQSFLLTLNFISRQNLLFEFKTIQPSTIGYLSYDNLIDILKQSKNDFEYYSFLRDKGCSIVDENETMKCRICHNRYHYQYDCPSRHYIANKQVIIMKNNYKRKYKYNHVQYYGLRLARHQNVFRYYDQCQILSQRIKNLQFLRRDSTKIMNSVTQTQQIQAYALPTFQNLYEANENSLYEVKNIIKQEMIKCVKIQEAGDFVWSVCSDILCDYKIYFQTYNPTNLKSIYRGRNYQQQNSLFAHEGK